VALRVDYQRRDIQHDESRCDGEGVYKAKLLVSSKAAEARQGYGTGM
jgi:hypothetical protein